MSIGGAEGQLVRIASGLVRLGLDVHVATVFPGMHDDALAATGAHIHRLEVWGKYDPLVLFRLISLCRRIRPDIMQTHLTQMDIVGGIAAQILAIPWILSERCMSEAYPPNVMNRVRAAMGSRADAVVANSEAGGEYWRNRVRRVHVIPNVVPQTEIDAVPSIGGDVEGEVVLCVGRFSAQKNLPRLLEALVPVIRGRNVTAVFCGDGLLRPDIEQKAIALGIAERTRFLGNVSNVWSWMKRAAAVVAVSSFEGNPNAVLEAMACGTPLVVSDIGGHRALLDERSAWFVDPRSVQSIADGLMAALADRDEAHVRSARARALIASRSNDDIAARYEGVYREVVGRLS